MLTIVFSLALSLAIAIPHPPISHSISHPIPHIECYTAYQQCKLRFKNFREGVPVFDILSSPDHAFTTRVVSKSSDVVIGIVNTNGILPEFVGHEEDVRAITSVGSPKFTPTHFKPYTMDAGTFSGIGHQTFTGNQGLVASGQCVRIFFTHLQILESIPPLRVKKNMVASRDDNMCVVFRTAPAHDGGH